MPHMKNEHCFWLLTSLVFRLLLTCWWTGQRSTASPWYGSDAMQVPSSRCSQNSTRVHPPGIWSSLMDVEAVATSLKLFIYSYGCSLEPLTSELLTEVLRCLVSVSVRDSFFKLYWFWWCGDTFSFSVPYKKYFD